MGNEFAGHTAHSAEYFGDTRDHWWNADFLRLMAQRWRLEAVRDVLDVGCGVGHWGATLASVLPVEARVVGIDRDPFWVEKATERAQRRPHPERFSYRVGEVQRLPFPDDSFDLTTCQTVLIHVPEPAEALAEMIRVTRPGGLVAVAEPNNVATGMHVDSESSRASIDEIIELVRFHLTCERGKANLGLGNNSLGDLLPGIFAASGQLEGIDVYLNDKVATLLPPYDTEAQRALVEEARTHEARDFWVWSQEETRKYFYAGGGDAAAFAAHWKRAMESRTRTAEALVGGTHASTDGSVCYLISGRKKR
jgi:SAM-dependent methyltransferase